MLAIRVECDPMIKREQEKELAPQELSTINHRSPNACPEPVEWSVQGRICTYCQQHALSCTNDE